MRGIVASKLGRRYVGIELRPEQVEANRAQLAITTDPLPDWRVGDARDLGTIASDVAADLIFSCPPYWNLERYSDDPANLSTMDEAAFFEAQAAIIAAAVARLKEDRFAVWVVGDVREEAQPICLMHLVRPCLDSTEMGGNYEWPPAPPKSTALKIRPPPTISCGSLYT